MQTIKRVVAIGFFDGVHIGHAALLSMAKQRAKESGAIPSVVSFDVHPDNLVLGAETKLITSTIGREDLIRRLFGIENIVFLHFNRHMMQMSWEEFIAALVDELSISHIVVGHDFCFGYRGEGTAEKLRLWCEEKGLGCDVIPPVSLDGRIVSSTYIRKLIEDGQIEEANRYLGHPHILSDTVHSGYHLGTKLGAPTINMFFPDGVLVPKHGVYATRVCLERGECYNAVTNVGIRPTVGADNRVSVESHLLDYSGNLYGRQARVEFYAFLRSEIKFASFQELGEQIVRDAEAARAYFAAKKEDQDSKGQLN